MAEIKSVVAEKSDFEHRDKKFITSEGLDYQDFDKKPETIDFSLIGHLQGQRGEQNRTILG